MFQVKIVLTLLSAVNYLSKKFRKSTKRKIINNFGSSWRKIVIQSPSKSLQNFLHIAVVVCDVVYISFKYKI